MAASAHISGLLFMDLTGTTAQVVPYRGNAPAMQDLVGGQIDMMVADPVTGVPQVRGKPPPQRVDFFASHQTVAYTMAGAGVFTKLEYLILN
jgi:ABC-type amino acid transport substrate-binding protein